MPTPWRLPRWALLIPIFWGGPFPQSSWAQPNDAGAASPPRMFAYVQTHSFDLRPLWREVKRGFALFVDSGAFTGKERVAVIAPPGKAFPGGRTSQPLTAFERRGEWYQPDAERIATAVSGAPASGEYRFVIQFADGRHAQSVVHFQPSFLASPTAVRVTGESQGCYHIEWTPPVGAGSFMVFLVPESSRDPLKDLLLVSVPGHPKAGLDIAAGMIPPGRYYVAIRANEHLPPGYLGYARESWGLSAQAYTFQ